MVVQLFFNGVSNAIPGELQCLQVFLQSAANLGLGNKVYELFTICVLHYLSAERTESSRHGSPSGLEFDTLALY
uniref:Uncharacterized protein n=1 Tax=Anguilla anguilla TaxID=7936 RepID=A0A0E9X0Q9_ANGAN